MRMASIWMRKMSGLSRETRTERQPMKGLSSLGGAEIGQGLVSADIEGADGDRMAAETLDDLAVELELVLPVGKIAPGHVGKLGAVEAHPFGAVSQRHLHIA